MEIEKEHEKTVPITIDKQHLKTPETTTGQGLYTLGSVAAGFDLFLDVKGPGSDQLIANDGQALTVKAGSHFYTVKQVLNPGHE